MTLNRIRYRERLRLRVSELEGEQEYRIYLRRRHNVRQHTDGIVTGLDLDMDEGDLLICPGFAIDSFGRELVVEQGLRIHKTDLTNAFDEMPDEIALSIWLLYGRSARSNRWQERVMLRLAPLLEWVGSKNDDRLSDDPYDESPVFLGFITKERLIRQLGRRYVGLVGNGVMGVSGQASFRLRPRQFTLSVQAEKLTERLIVDVRDDGSVAAAVYGNLHLQGKPGEGEALALGVDDDSVKAEDKRVVGIGFEPVPTEEPPKPRMWQVYRVVSGEAPNQRDQLVIALLHPGTAGNPADYQLTVRQRDVQENDTVVHVPRMVVQADGTLVVYGNLEVGGDVRVGPREPDINDPNFGQGLAGAWVSGAQLTNAELDRIYDPGGTSRLNVLIEKEPEQVETGVTVEYTVWVENKGEIPLLNVIVTLMPLFDGEIEPTEALEQFDKIDAGGSEKTKIVVNRANAGRLTLFVTAGSFNDENQLTDLAAELKHIMVVVGNGGDPG